MEFTKEVDTLKLGVSPFCSVFFFQNWGTMASMAGESILSAEVISKVSVVPLLLGSEALLSVMTGVVSDHIQYVREVLRGWVGQQLPFPPKPLDFCPRRLPLGVWTRCWTI